MTRARRLALALALLGSAAAAQEDAEPARAEFSGRWSTTFGLVTLEQQGARVQGRYLASGPATLEGTVRGRRLTFRYAEPDTAGEGWFELSADGRGFSGRWRPDGQEAWEDWVGVRAPAAAAPSGPFEGLFDTNEGPLRFFQSGDAVRAVYRYDGRAGSLRGTATGRRLTFRWREGDRSGEGEFSIAGDRDALEGRWRGEGDVWTRWSGVRVTPKPDTRWLVVLEAQWEERLAQREYSFGAMLEAYLRRFPHVQVRQRRFADRDDFVREARSLAFLAEPVVLLVASHGEGGKLQVGEGDIDPEALGGMLADLPTLQLVHFSSCEMMVGDVATRIRSKLPRGRRLPISGYAVSVDWSASALIEFLYLDLILGRGYEPGRAALVLRRELAFAGDEETAGSPLGASKFRFSDGPY